MRKSFSVMRPNAILSLCIMMALTITTLLFTADLSAQNPQSQLLASTLQKQFIQIEIPTQITIDDALLQRNFLTPFNPADKNFSEAAVMQGAILPMEFVRNTGFGLYSDDPFVNDKPLLVLVHGMTDSPLRWQPLVKKLNHENYQILRFHYPTGMPLKTSAAVLAKMLERVQLRSPRQRIILVGHSMGGLVARQAINDLAIDNKANTIDYFFSVATPWGGHQLANIGAEQSPLVVPVWRDLAINSDFLQQLHVQPLPKQIIFTLLYATAGNNKVLAEPNDGVVTVKSQLDSRARREAKQVIAIAAPHVAALTDSATIKTLNAALFSSAAIDTAE